MAAVGTQLSHVLAHNATKETPLCAFKKSGHWFVVTAQMITDLLCQDVRECPSCGLKPEEVSARCLSASGAMAILCDGINPDITQLLGRWRFDNMMTYFHIQAKPLYRDLSARMLHGGDYSFVLGSKAHTT